MRLNIPAGTAVRFEPGDVKESNAGRNRRGARDLWPEWPDQRAGEAMRPRPKRWSAPAAAGFLEKQGRMSLKIPRRQYADLYGPTTGDRVRLADTELFIEIEKDLTTPGEEAKFGGGKVIRDGMGQSARATAADGVLDSGDHQRGDRGPRRNLQSRHRNSRRPNRGNRQSWKSGHDERRDAGNGHRRGNGSDRRRRKNRHGRRDRRPRSFYLPATGGDGAVGGPDDADRRRHGPGHRHGRHHLHARRLEHAPHARIRGRVPDQSGIFGQGKFFVLRRRCASRSKPARLA